MNKQEIEKAIEVITIIHEHIDLESDLNQDLEECFPTIISALTQQLNNGWIPVTPETNPKKSDIYLLTFEENGNRYVERFYFSIINGWMMPVHWQDEGHIDEIIAWQPLPEPYKEVSE
jgi:hypothetical protein